MFTTPQHRKPSNKCTVLYLLAETPPPSSKCTLSVVATSPPPQHVSLPSTHRQRPCLSSLCLFSSKLISTQTPSQEEQRRVKIRNKKAVWNDRRRKQSCDIKISQVASAVNMPQSEQEFIHHFVF